MFWEYRIDFFEIVECFVHFLTGFVELCLIFCFRAVGKCVETEQKTWNWILLMCETRESISALDSGENLFIFWY